MHSFEDACEQFDDVFLDSIVHLTGDKRWWSAAILIVAATDALGGAHLDPIGETTGRTFRKFVEDRYPDEYKPHADQLYRILRSGLLHAGRIDKHGRNATNKSLGDVYLTHRDIKPAKGANGTLTVSVPHLHKALLRAFGDFKVSPTRDERNNFPQRFEIVLGDPWDEQFQVGPTGTTSTLSPAPSGMGRVARLGDHESDREGREIW